MKEHFKYFLERTTPLGALARFHRTHQLKRKFRQWQNENPTGPMPNFGKQQVVIDYIKKFSPKIFIETGTYKGKMVYAVMPHVREIYSMELDPIHCQNAQKRFAGYPNVHILKGQSGEVLPDILKGIDEPCLFWLDAHYSGGSTAKGDLETPIMQELQYILSRRRMPEHVILIDDARCFTGKNDYPILETLEQFVREVHPSWTFEVEDDIIRTHPNRCEHGI